MAWEIINELTPKEYERELKRAREKAFLDEQSKIQYQEYKLREAERIGIEKGMQEVIEKGIQQGIKKEKYMIAKRLLIKEQDIDTVIDITQLTKEEVERIIKEIKD